MSSTSPPLKRLLISSDRATACRVSAAPHSARRLQYPRSRFRRLIRERRSEFRQITTEPASARKIARTGTHRTFHNGRQGAARLTDIQERKK